MIRPEIAPGGTDRFVFLTWLRAIAVWLVIWFHLVETFTRVNGVSFLPARLYQSFISGPLKLDSGQLGVAIFFVVSGFIITHVALRESRLDFAVRRFFRIYPPVMLSVALYAGAVHALRVYSLPVEEAAEITPSLLAGTILLVPFITDTFQPFLPVLWTLSLEVLFYAVTLVLSGFLKSKPQVAVVTAVALMFLITETAPHDPAWARPLSLLTTLTPLFTGQVIYLGWSGKIGRWLTAVCLVALWIAAERAIQTNAGNVQYAAVNAVSVWRMFAYLLVTLFLFCEEQLRPRTVIGFSADISYSLYLLHLPVGYLTLGVLTPRIGYTTALLVAVALTITASALSFRFVEEPCRRFARSLRRIPAHEVRGLS